MKCRANFHGVNLLAKFVKKKIKGRCRQIDTLTPPEWKSSSDTPGQMKVTLNKEFKPLLAFR